MADFRAKVGIDDQFTGPLAKMKGALGSVREAGQQAGAALRKDFEGAHGVLTRTTGALQQMTPVLSGLGVGSFAATAGIAGLGAALKSFTGNTAALERFSHETGISIDKLRAFGALGERFGVSTSTMQGAVQGIARNMYELRRRWGETYSGLQKMNLGDLAEQLVSAPNMEVALKRIMDKLGSIKDPEKRRRVAALLGAEELASVAGEVGNKYEQTMADIARRLGRTTQQQINAAKQFEQSVSELRQNLDGLATQSLTPVIEKLNAFTTALQSPEANKVLKGAIDYMANRITGMANEIKFLMETYEKLKGFMGNVAAGAPSVSGAPLAPSGPLGPGKPGAAIENSLRAAQQKLGDLYRSGDKDAVREKELTGEIRRLTDELRKVREQGASVNPSSFGAAGDGAARIFNAGYGGGGAILWGGRGA